MSQFQIRHTAPLLPLLLVACGGGDGGTATSDVALRFSDAPVEALESVVVKVESITFRRENGEDIVVEQFTSEELDLIEADSFTIDLLDVQGENSALVLDSVELPVGRYSDLRLDIADEDLNDSYVMESAEAEGYDGEPKLIKVPSDELKLGGFEVSPVSSQTFVIEFGLRQSMTYNPGPDRYILKPRGVRIVALQDAATIVGRVDINALNSDAACNTKAEPSFGNAVYLYPGAGLTAANLADDFDPEIEDEAGDGLVAPIASALVSGEGEFVFSYLQPGGYTIAASCAAAGDMPDTLDAGIVVPQPGNQLVPLTLALGQRQECTLGVAEPGCAVIPATDTDDSDNETDAEDDESDETDTEDTVETDDTVDVDEVN